jgi:hypothetical protein
MGATRQDVLDRLASAPARVAAAARALDAAEAVSGPPAGEWTARQSVGHMCRVETEVFGARLTALEAAEPPSWVWHEPDTAEAPFMAATDLALAEFATRRGATLARLAALDEAGWAKWGTHATYGRLDVAGLMTVAADHDDQHIAGLLARTSAGA